MWTGIIKKEDLEIISTSHKLAKELLSKPDGFITAVHKGDEYIIENLKGTITHANNDDSVIHWAVNLRDGGKGNIKR